MKAAIFDLDGTLLHSMHVWQANVNQILLGAGINPPEDLINITKTLGMTQAITYMVESFALDYTPEQALADFSTKMAYEYDHNLALKPYALDYLQKLKTLGLPMVIATATARPLVLGALRRLDIEDYFQFIVTVEEVGVGKHDPAIFQYCSQHLNLPPKDCTVYEDSLQAIITAKKAGFSTIAIEEPTAILEKPQIIAQAERYIIGFEELLKD